METSKNYIPGLEYNKKSRIFIINKVGSIAKSTIKCKSYNTTSYYMSKRQKLKTTARISNNLSKQYSERLEQRTHSSNWLVAELQVVNTVKCCNFKILSLTVKSNV